MYVRIGLMRLLLNGYSRSGNCLQRFSTMTPLKESEHLGNWLDLKSSTLQHRNQNFTKIKRVYRLLTTCINYTISYTHLLLVLSLLHLVLILIESYSIFCGCKGQLNTVACSDEQKEKVLGH